jgi:hypothetical protein
MVGTAAVTLRKFVLFALHRYMCGCVLVMLLRTCRAFIADTAILTGMSQREISKQLSTHVSKNSMCLAARNTICKTLYLNACRHACLKPRRLLTRLPPHEHSTNAPYRTGYSSQWVQTCGVLEPRRVRKPTQIAEP